MALHDTAIRRSAVFAGHVGTVPAARRWTQQVLADAAMPRGTADDALMCVSELATNSVLHTRSGDTGGTYQVLITVHGERVRIEVIDQGSRQLPIIQPGEEERGRGLLICDRLGVLDHAVADGRCRVWVDLPRQIDP